MFHNTRRTQMLWNTMVTIVLHNMRVRRVLWNTMVTIVFHNIRVRSSSVSLRAMRLHCMVIPVSAN